MDEAPYGVKIIAGLTALTGVILTLVGTVRLASLNSGYFLVALTGFSLLYIVALLVGVGMIFASYKLVKLEKTGWRVTLGLYGSLLILSVGAILPIIFGAAMREGATTSAYISRILPLAVDTAINWVIVDYLYKKREIFR